MEKNGTSAPIITTRIGCVAPSIINLGSLLNSHLCTLYDTVHYFALLRDWTKFTFVRICRPESDRVEEVKIQQNICTRECDNYNSHVKSVCFGFSSTRHMKGIYDLYFSISVRNSNSVRLHHILIEGEQFVIYRWQELLLTERHTKKYMSNACAFNFARKIYLEKRALPIV